MERSTIFNGKTHYFDWAIFNSYVKLPEGTTLYPYRPHDFDFAIPLALYHWGIRYWYAHKEDFKKSKKTSYASTWCPGRASNPQRAW